MRMQKPLRSTMAAIAVELVLLPAILLPLSEASAQAPTAKATRIKDRIRLDARLDEVAWQLATPIGPLVQRDPREGEPATEETEVRVAFSSDAIYLGILCRDKSPSAIVSSQMRRDADLSVDDSVLVIVDPFFDHRYGFFFEVNPSGARADGQVANNDEHRSYDWDGIWNAAARITSEGWVAEIEIPFKTLRFKPGQAVWGFNVERHIKRRNETDRWAGARRDLWITNLAEAGRLEGLHDIKQGRGLDLRPYVAGGKKDSDGKLDVGLDLSKNLSPNLNASFTVNTDFAETEADIRQVNLTRFPLFYPEKRAFFLEGAGVFEAAGTSTSRDLLPFFSRRIGLHEGREVPILLGAKVTGRQSGYNIGFLDVQTRAIDKLNLAAQNLLVARMSRNFWRQSSAGVLLTRGNPAGTGDNRLIGADAHLATSAFRGGKNLSLDLFIFRTNDKGSRSAASAGGFKIDYPNDLWDIALTWKQIGENFKPALGFVPRTGIRRTNLGVEFRPRPERFGIRQFFFEFRPEIITNLDNVVENWRIFTAPLNLETESGEHVEFNYVPEFERLDAPFEINPGIIIPAGSYEWNRFAAEVSTASKRKWVVEFGWGWGGFYNGHRRLLEAGLTLKPNTHLLFAVRGERNDVSLLQGKFYTQIVSLRADCNFSPNVTWANLVQYDNESRILGFQSRFRWTLKPGNDLFLVLNRGWYRTFDGDYLMSFDRATAKLQYTFRF